MDGIGGSWYFLTMAKRLASRSANTPKTRVQSVAFNRRKYGRHLLIDVGWVHELKGFLFTEPHALQFFDVMLVTRGSGWFWLDSERHAVRPGSVFFTSPGQVRRW